MLKRFFLIIVIILSVSNLIAEVVIKQGADKWTISGDNYNAVIDKTGCFRSIKVQGEEFLSNSPKTPGGAYFCHKKGIRKQRSLSKGDGNVLLGKNAFAKVKYEFFNTKIKLTINNFELKNMLYMIINSDIKKVNYSNGKDSVPTIATVPANAKCRVTRWFYKDVTLDIIGSDSIWGPWKEHQVLQLNLNPQDEKIIEFIPGKANEADKQAKPKENVTQEFTYETATSLKQIPICMIGDSITWAGKGDYWRKNLIELMPSLAFVGTHSGMLGYSHAGEGGNSTVQVLARIGEIPACPYYSLLIGTNDNAITDESKVQNRALITAKRIQNIVLELLKKKGVKKVFLCSILPCKTNNPLRDKTNSATNVILRREFDSVFDNDKVVWIEFEKPIRIIEDWGSKIELHPTVEGYGIIAKIHADKIAEELDVKDMSRKIDTAPNTGVQVYNLFDSKLDATRNLVTAGWYTLSFYVQKTKAGASVTLLGDDSFSKVFEVAVSDQDKRLTFNLFTGYEGYGYNRSALKLKTKDCTISKVLLEKRRPSGKASEYYKGAYIDITSEKLPGELIEKKE